MAVRYKKKGKRLQFADEDEDNQEDVSPLVGEGGDEIQSVEQSNDKEKKKNARVCCYVNSWKTVIIAVLAFFAAVGISAFISKFVGKASASNESVNSHSSRAGVATDVPVCSAMGADILKANGSAVDAAITALLCVGVVNIQSSGIGGGAFMMIYDKGNTYSLNFRETAPGAATQGMYHSNATLAIQGALAVAVPGELRGMEEAHRRFGRLPWSSLFDPVIAMCKNGFPMTAHTVSCLGSTSQSFRDQPVIRTTYYNSDGSMKKVGDTIKRPDFAKTLQLIATNGPDIFYNGTLGQEMVTELQNQSGIITMDDLLQYRAVWEQPVCMQIGGGGYNICAPGVPSGGPVLLFALKVLDNYHMTPASSTQNLAYHRIAETFKYAFALRSFLGDPYCEECPSDDILRVQNLLLLNETFATSIKNSIDDSRTYNYTHYNGAYGVEDQGTSHVSVLGLDGQAVSVTSTVNTYFGSKVFTKSGILLNNEMDDFSSPNITNFYNVEPSEANFIEPYKRPLSSMCPAIAINTVTGKVSLVVGASGGTRILTATTLVTLRTLMFQQSIADAIEAKRLHHQLLPEPLYLEKGIPNDIMAYLQGKGFTFTTVDFLAVVQGILRDSNGNVTAHSDSRKQGQATVL